jgi:hypothetical protein
MQLVVLLRPEATAAAMPAESPAWRKRQKTRALQHFTNKHHTRSRAIRGSRLRGRGYMR